MEIQEFLTYFINTLVLSSIIFFLFDLCFCLLNSWQVRFAQGLGCRVSGVVETSQHPTSDPQHPNFQLNPSAQPDFYSQVKDLLWDNNTQLAL